MQVELIDFYRWYRLFYCTDKILFFVYRKWHKTVACLNAQLSGAHPLDAAYRCERNSFSQYAEFNFAPLGVYLYFFKII